MEAMNRWDAGFRKLVEVYEQLGAEIHYRFGTPVPPDRVADLEMELEYSLPPSVRHFLTEVSGSLVFGVRLPETLEFPFPFNGIFHFRLEVSPESILAGEMERRNWVDVLYNDPDDEYARIWQDTRGLLNAPEGDLKEGDVIAIERVGDGLEPRVIFLSHDGMEEHGAVLANDFADYIDRVIAVGGLGTDSWQFGPFLADAESGIQTDCANAKQYREMIGLAW